MANEQVRALGVQADTGEAGTISDAAQPGVHFHQVHVGSEETGMTTTPEPSPRGTPNP
jgi:hypothetical protein